MSKTFSEWMDFLYGPIFKVIGFVYRIYTANRERVARLLDHARVAAFLRALAVLILIGWLLVWLLAPDEDRSRLTDEVRQTLGFDSQPTAE